MKSVINACTSISLRTTVARVKSFLDSQAWVVDDNQHNSYQKASNSRHDHPPYPIVHSFNFIIMVKMPYVSLSIMMSSDNLFFFFSLLSLRLTRETGLKFLSLPLIGLLLEPLMFMILFLHELLIVFFATQGQVLFILLEGMHVHVHRSTLFALHWGSAYD